MTSLLAEHLYLANPIDVAELHEKHLGYRPDWNDGRIGVLARVKRAVERRSSPDRMRLMAAERVARMIVSRWYDHGIRRWQRDEGGLAIPLEREENHDWRFAYQFSPSGKSLFSCWSCKPKPIPTRGPVGPCPGSRFGFEADNAVALAIFGGAVYEPDARGIPLPTNREVRACSCCKLVGPWTDRDPIARQTVCQACAKDSKALLRGREMRAAICGRPVF